METIDIRYTRGDDTTRPGGIILRRSGDEWIAHHFTRELGSLEPTEFFWGSYCFTEERGRAEFADKVNSRLFVAFYKGGSLIDERDLDDEIADEKKRLVHKQIEEAYGNAGTDALNSSDLTRADFEAGFDHCVEKIAPHLEEELMAADPNYYAGDEQ